jgi:hypothetical protein
VHLPEQSSPEGDTKMFTKAIVTLAWIGAMWMAGMGLYMIANGGSL